MLFININRIREKLRVWSEDLEQVPVLGKIVKKSKMVTLPGLQRIPVYTVAGYFMESLGKGVIFQRAAALTYRVFVALVPMIIAFFSVIAFLGDGVQRTVLSLLESFVPDYVWPVVSDMITYVVTQQNGALSSLMFFFGIYFTIICVNGLLATLNTSYFNEYKRNIFKQLLLSVMIMLITFFIIIVVVALFIIASVLIRYFHDNFFHTSNVYYYLIHAIKWILIYAAIYFMVGVLYYLAPVHKENYRFFSAGSSTCTILLVLLLWVLNVYFSNFSNYNLIYGSLGAIFAILLWINFSSVILLIGFDLNVSIAKAKEESEMVPKENNVTKI